MEKMGTFACYQIEAPSPEQALQPPGFLRLPLELRWKIYEPLLMHYRVTYVRKPRSQIDVLRKVGLVSVCKAVSDEALDVLYGRNQFIIYVTSNAHEEFNTTGERNLRRLRHVCIITSPDYSLRTVPRRKGYDQTLELEPKLWTPLLSDITRLIIVIHKPLWEGAHPHIPLYVAEMKQFEDYVAKLLEFLAENLHGKPTKVLIDDDDQKETRELVLNHFFCGHYRLYTAIGDHVFGVGLRQKIHGGIS